MGVDVLTRQESVELVRARSRGWTPADEEALADLLGDHPLALAQATAFVENTGTPPGEYLRLVQSRGADLLTRDESLPTYAGSVAEGVRASVDRLRADAPAAAELVELLAFFGPAPVPVDLLRDGAHLLDPPIDGIVADPIAFADAIRAAGRYSLLSRDGDAVLTHRLVQTTVRAAVPEEVRLLRSGQVEAMLAQAAPGDPELPVNWPAFAGLLPHVQVSASNRTQSFRGLQLDVGWYLAAIGDADRCRAYAADLTSLIGGLPDEGDQVMHLEAVAAWLQRDFTAAKSLDESIVVESRPGSPRSPELRAAHNRALCLAALGDAPTAIADLGTVQRLQIAESGGDHPDVIAARANIAVLRLPARTDRKRASSQAASLEIVFADAARVLGTDHPRTLTVMSNLAVAHQLDDRADEAQMWGIQALDLRRRFLGPQHRSTLVSVYNVANLLVSDVERGDEGIAMAREAADGFARVLGPDHPYTDRARKLADGKIREPGLTELQPI